MTKKPIEIDGHLWFNRDGKQYLGSKRIALLEQVDRSGSISQAAKQVGLSYKAAWDAVNAMNNLSDRPLVNCSVGGQGGGGTRLTPLGKQLVHTWQRMQAEYERFLAQVAEGIENFNNINSPRNKLSSCFHNHFTASLCCKLHHYPCYIVHERLISNKDNIVVTFSFVILSFVLSRFLFLSHFTS